MIVLKNVYKSYKVGKKNYNVLKDINLSLKDKGFVSILGPSGCGKTTLLNIIGGLDKADSGDLIINNVSTKDYKSKDWDAYRNNHIGFVFQHFNLINHFSVYSNIELTLRLSRVKRKDRKTLINSALEKVGLSNMANTKVNKLSGGEKQRVAIARAIVNKPEIILADEPTGSLDSENSIEIMNILKELSKEHLIILVTHNEELAIKYSDEIIKIKDGKINSDNNNNEVINTDTKKMKKVHISLLMSILLSFKNMYNKLLRTLMIILAGSIGIVAVIMVLSVSKGVNEYIDYVQTSALSDYPIVISSSTVVTTSGTILNSRTAFPDTNEIIVTTTISNYEQVSNLDSDFIDYLDQMDNSKYTILNYNRKIKMRIMSKVEDEYKMMYNPSAFTEVIDDIDFLDTQYDVLVGTFPTKYNEICLVVDKYNSISSTVLSTLGMDYSKDVYTFDEIIGKEYKLIDNNDYYYFDESRGYYRANSSSSKYEQLYENATDSLKIVGIIREKENCAYALYSTGMIYSSKLTDYVLEKANNSDIVKEQRKYGYDVDVTTGEPYEQYVSETQTMSIEYQFESDMISYAAEATVTRINIYSMSFDDRLYVNDYVKAYEKGLSHISYSDKMSTITNELSSFVKVLSKVLLILALISLLISIIMVATINYISVLERTTEIGILRSVGARRIDIGTIFCVEAIIIGLLSGILGIGLFYIFKNPINTFVQNVIVNSLEYTSARNYNMIQTPKLLLYFAILGSAFLTFVSSLLPAMIASFKKPVDAFRHR